MKLVRENIEFKRGKPLTKALNIGKDRIPEIGDTIMVDIGREKIYGGIDPNKSYMKTVKGYGPDRGFVPMKVINTPHYYKHTMGSTKYKGKVISPGQWNVEVVDENGIERIAQKWDDLLPGIWFDLQENPEERYKEWKKWDYPTFDELEKRRKEQGIFIPDENSIYYR